MTSPITPYSGTVPNPFAQSQPAFDANTQSFVDYITELPGEINQFAADLGTVNTNSTSTTSNTIGTGSKAFTVQTGKSYFPGQSLTIARTSAPTNRMFAVVNSYNSGTGALVVTSQAFEGSGTFTDWTITLGFNGVIQSGQIANGAVGTGQITNAAVTADKINNTAVTKGKLNSDVRASASNVNTGTAEDVFLNPKTYRENNWHKILPNNSTGVQVDFTAIPAWATCILVPLGGLSTNGTAEPLMQLGDAGGYEVTGYAGYFSRIGANGSANSALSSGILLANSWAATYHAYGHVMLTKIPNTNTWDFHGVINIDVSNSGSIVAGRKTLSDVLTSLRFYINGTQVFDEGSFCIYVS
jgi:hypothetical protein